MTLPDSIKYGRHSPECNRQLAEWEITEAEPEDPAALAAMLDHHPHGMLTHPG